MSESNTWSPKAFSEVLYEKMKQINVGVENLELYEFRYGLDNLYPENGGWASVELDTKKEIERLIDKSDFYASIQLRPRVDGRIVLDENIGSPETT